MAASSSSSETCKADGSTSNDKSRILFGSCNSHEYPQPLWPVIASRNATAFIWAGDAIYADQTHGIDYSVFPPRPIVGDSSPERLRFLYNQQLQNEGYKQVLDKMYVTGTWDDHDYGVNNGDIRYPYKLESAIAFTDFLGESPKGAMGKRARDGHGVYGVKLFDFTRTQPLLTEQESGLDPDVDNSSAIPYSEERSVAVFLLDVRSFKTPWPHTHLDANGEFLGERQWKWFEESLRRSKAAVNIVVQGLQVHADRFPDGNVAENWAKFPGEQHRLYDALLQKEAPSLLVSGDIHMAIFMRKDCQHSDKKKSLVEVTTSGLTHSWGTRYCSRPRSSSLCRNSYFTWVAARFMHFAHWINPLTDVMLTENKEMQYTMELNFAEMEFDWTKRAINLTIVGRDGVALLHDEWAFDDLTTGGLPGSLVREQDYEAIHREQQALGLKESEWKCVNYRGPQHPWHVTLGLIATGIYPMCLLLAPVFIAVGLCTWLVLRTCRRKK